MNKLYFFDDGLDYVMSSDGYGQGFKTFLIESEDDNYFYFDRTNRVCKKTHKIQWKSIITKDYNDCRDNLKLYPTKELWEKAKSDYFAKLLSDNEADRQKILKSMEAK